MSDAIKAMADMLKKYQGADLKGGRESVDIGGYVGVIKNEITGLRAQLAERDAQLSQLAEAVRNLPVDEWVEHGPRGEAELIGYLMQAQGEWDDVLRALPDRASLES